jgi:hypothetical protein
MLTYDPVEVSNEFHVEPPEGGPLRPFRLTDVQADLLPKIWQRQLEGPSYHIILKARRMGVTSGVQYLALWKLCTTKNYVVSNIAHNESSATLIARYLHLFFDTAPSWFHDAMACSPSCDHPAVSCAFRYRRQDYWEMIWGSRLQIFTASSQDAARATGSQFLHLSEAAYYPDAERLTRSLMPTLPKLKPGVVVVVESTGAGAEGWFYEEYMRAKEAEAARAEGKNPANLFVPHFYPWFYDSRYRLEGELFPDERYSDEEEYLRSLGVDDQALLFRRYVIENEFGGDQDAFRQEYPSTEEDAFRRAELSVFPYARLRAQAQRAQEGIAGELVRRVSGYELFRKEGSPLRIFREPDRKKTYLIGADPAVTASQSSDYAAAVVVTEYGGKLEVVASLQVKADVESFGEQLIKLARYYNNAMICPEQNSGAGRHLISYLLRRGYPRLWQNRDMIKRGVPLKEAIGWSTTRVSKEMLVSEMIAALWQDSIILTDKRIIAEMFDYTERPAGRERYGPLSRDGHDDLVMATMISLVAWKLGHPRKLVDTSRWDTYLSILRKMGVPA